MEGSRVRPLFVVSGDCCVCSLLETQPISVHPPAGSLFPCPWLGSNSSPGTSGCLPPGVHVSQDCGSDTQDIRVIFIRLFSVCCPHCWPFLADRLQAFGVPASSSFSASSESPLPSGSSLTLFLVFCSGWWVAGGQEDAPGP